MRMPNILLIGLLASGSAAAEPVSLVQNEYAFASDVAAHGIRDGFLDYLDKQSITFAPKPVNAFDFYTQRKPNSTQLKWYPVYAVVSADGQFGVDTGPWTADWIQDAKPQKASGEWLTVWAKDKTGNWRAIFDGGVSHDLPETPEKPLVEDAPPLQLPAPVGPAPTPDGVRNELEKRDKLFSEDAAGGLKAAYENAAADDIHLLLDNSQPLVGRETVLAAFAKAEAKPAGLQWVSLGGGVATSGDLAYVYGMTYKNDDSKLENPQGVYMHVWRRDKDGAWKLLISEEQPLLQPKS